jgi:hypothetical protein
LTSAILIEVFRCLWALAFSSINTANCSTVAGIGAARIFIASSVVAHAPRLMRAPERRPMAGVRDAASYAIDGLLDLIRVGTDALSGTIVSIDAVRFFSPEEEGLVECWRGSKRFLLNKADLDFTRS